MHKTQTLGVTIITSLSITFSDIQVEEVTVKSCLDTSSNNGDKVIEPFIVVSVDPVNDVQSSVGTQGKQVMAGDCLCLASLGDHKQLRQDCY